MSLDYGILSRLRKAAHPASPLPAENTLTPEQVAEYERTRPPRPEPRVYTRDELRLYATARTEMPGNGFSGANSLDELCRYRPEFERI